MSQREEAINNAYNQNQSGRTSFYYVQISTLERLGITQFKSQVNDNFIRIMPPKDPKAFWAREVYIHTNVGANRATFICLNKMFGKSCPVCEYIEQLKAGGADPETLKPLYAKKRFIMFVVDVRDDSTIVKGLRWYDAPPKLVGEIIGRSKDKRSKEVIDVCDPKEGRDIEFVRKGQGLKTDYTGIDLKVTAEVPPDWYENVPTFDEILVIPTYEQVNQQLTGGVSESSEQLSDEVPESVNPNTPVDDDGQDEGYPAEQPTPAPEATKPQPATSRPSTGITPRGAGGPSPRGTTPRAAAQTPPAVSGSVRDKIAEIKARRAQGQV